MWTLPSICPPQQRVDGAPHVVGRDHPLDSSRHRVGDHHLGRITEGAVDHRILEAVLELVGPVDAVLTFVVDADLAAAFDRSATGGAHRSGSQKCSPGPGGLTIAELRLVSTNTRMRAGSTPSSSTATWRATVLTPCPISVQP